MGMKMGNRADLCKSPKTRNTGKVGSQEQEIGYTENVLICGKMNFRDWIITEAKKLTFDDPTGLGMEITATIDRVPGPEGKGAYIGTIHFNNSLRYGGAVYHTEFAHSLEAAQTILRKRLQQPFSIRVHSSYH